MWKASSSIFFPFAVVICESSVKHANSVNKKIRKKSKKKKKIWKINKCGKIKTFEKSELGCVNLKKNQWAEKMAKKLNFK